MLRQADEFAIAQLAQQGNVSFANRRSQIAVACQRLGLRQKIGRSLILLQTLTEHNARLALRLFLLLATSDKAWPVAPNEQPNRGDAEAHNQKLRDTRNDRRAAGLNRLSLGKQTTQPAEETFQQSIECTRFRRGLNVLRAAKNFSESPFVRVFI